MSPLLKEYLNQKVVVVTIDGHSIVGVLEGYDKSINLILSNVQSNYNLHKSIKESSNNGGGGGIVSVQVCRGSEVVFCGVLSQEEEGEGKMEKEEESDTLRNVTQWDILKTTKNIIKDEHLIWKQVWLQNQQKKKKSLTRLRLLSIVCKLHMYITRDISIYIYRYT